MKKLKVFKLDGTFYEVDDPGIVLPQREEKPTELEQLRADVDYIAMETGVEL